jgi:hypothetical protein
MKYFTRDWYKEMTMMGFFAFPESMDEWNERIKSLNAYNESGIDYIEILRDDLEKKKEDLLKYLPESFHSYIYDGTLNTTYPSQKLRKMADEWIKKTDEKTTNVLKEYNNFFNSIRDSIPNNAQKIHEFGMHDARVFDFTEKNKTFEMIFKDRDLKFTFTNVYSLHIPNHLKGRYWLYDEIYPTDNGFELRVLLDDLSELRLTAVNVLIEELK